MATYPSLEENCGGKTVDLSYMGLSMLHPSWLTTDVEHLILDGNNLDEDIDLPLLPLLKTLSVNKNNIGHLDKFLCRVAKSCPKLKHLSLIGNPVCPVTMLLANPDQYSNFRSIVVSYLPYLIFLDSSAVSFSDRKRGVPESFPPQRTKGVYRKIKYAYSGNNSEGNRFIKDEEL